MSNDALITIPKHLTEGAELVVIPRKEYEELQLYRTEMRGTLKTIERGEQEYKDGRTRTVKSLDKLSATE